MSFTHKAVIWSLFKLNIVLKNLFHKSGSIWFAIWGWGIKSESLAAIYGRVTFNIWYQMTAIYNLLSVTCYLKLATTCKNLFLSLVVVCLIIFIVTTSITTQHSTDFDFDKPLKKASTNTVNCWGSVWKHNNVIALCSVRLGDWGREAHGQKAPIQGANSPL